MSDRDRTYGSAVGIPEPPDTPTSGTPERTHGAGAPRRPAARRHGRRWLVWLIVLPTAAIVVILANRESDSGPSAIDRLDVGDCFDAPDTDAFTGADIDEISCDQPHNHEVYAIGTTTTPIDSDANAENNPEIIRICRTDVASSILAALARTAGVTPGVVVDRGKPGRLVCTANTGLRSGSLIERAAAS